jgi:hypothetical protein
MSRRETMIFFFDVSRQARRFSLFGARTRMGATATRDSDVSNASLAPSEDEKLLDKQLPTQIYGVSLCQTPGSGGSMSHDTTHVLTWTATSHDCWRCLRLDADSVKQEDMKCHYYCSGGDCLRQSGPTVCASRVRACIFVSFYTSIAFLSIIVKWRLPEKNGSFFRGKVVRQHYHASI